MRCLQRGLGLPDSVSNKTLLDIKRVEAALRNGDKASIRASAWHLDDKEGALGINSNQPAKLRSRDPPATAPPNVLQGLYLTAPCKQLALWKQL